MRAFSLVLRALLKSSRLAASGLLFFTFVTAAEAQPSRADAKAPVCDVHTTTLGSLRQQAAKFGPVAKGPKKRRGVLISTTPRIRRGSYSAGADDDQAIQNDSPAARIDVDERPEPALRPLGLLSSPLDRLPFDRLFCPRSPRGPPPTT